MHGTIFGLLELRNVADGKLCAVLGSEWPGEEEEKEDVRGVKRMLMVRGGVGSRQCGK